MKLSVVKCNGNFVQYKRWKALCILSSVLCLISCLVLAYLKFLGEVMPFCFYDNFYYALYYFVLLLYSFLVMDFPHMTISKSQCRKWYTIKFLACCICFLELEALIQFVFTYRQITFELEIDTVARPYVHILLALGMTRLLLYTMMTSVAIRYLNRTIVGKAYRSDIFGSVMTFFADFTVGQLYLYTNYLYDFSLPIVLFTSCIAYGYYKHIRD